MSHIKWILILVFLGFSIGIVTGGYFFYTHEVEIVRRAKYQELKSVSQLKSDQIKLWRKERISDARILAEDVRLAESYKRWQKNPDQILDGAYLINRLESVRKNYDYQQVILTDKEGRVAIPHSDAIHLTNPLLVKMAKQTISEQKILFGGFSLCNTCDKIHLNLFAPLIDLYGETVAAVILVIDPNLYLYPLLRSWPTTNQSSEILIIRKEGDHVLFLNPLRRRKATAMKLKVPLDRSKSPSVQAISGKTGMFEGVNDQGVKVLAHIQPIEGSNWYMIAQVETEEILKQVAGLARDVVIVVSLSLLAAGLGMGLLFYFRQKNLFQDLYVAELQLTETREWFRATLYSIGDGVIVTDVEGRIRQMNPVAESLTGWSEKEAFNQHIDNIFHVIDESSRNTVQSPVTQVLHQEGVIGFASRSLLIARDGVERPISESGAPLHDKEGKVIGVVLVFRDQTEERKMEYVLRQHQALLQNLMDNSPAMIYLIDRRGRFLMVNQKIASFFNHEVQEIIGKIREEFLPKSIAKKQNALDMMVLKSKTIQMEEIEIKDTDGKHIYLVTRFPVFDSKNKAFAVGSIATDVTHYRRMESDLKAGEARYQALVESATDHLYMLDLKGKFLSSNNRVSYLCVKAENQIIEKTIEDVLTSESADSYRLNFNQLLETAAPVCFEMQTSDISGQDLEIETTLYPIFRDNALHAVGGIARDITEYKRLEKQYRQAQKMQAIGQLAGGVAHDFNNMLGIILGFAEICLDSVSPQEALYEDLNEIVLAARRSKEMTTQLLAFARQQTIAPKVIDINTMIRYSERMLRRLIGEDIQLKFIPGDDIWPIKMDLSQLHQILANLAINARDAIAGTGLITIETSNTVLDEGYAEEHMGFQSGKFVLLTFSDSGMGMDKNILSKIFDPFFTTKTEDKGTGLGLSTVYGAIKQNNGFLNVYSEIGLGTTFKIFFPRVTATYDEIDLEEFQDQITGTETILVVEDELQILRLCRRALEPLGYEILEAGSPSEAISICEAFSDPIHLLLTDVIMPGMNGKELAEKITSLKSGIRLLFTSGYTANVIADRGVLIEGVNFIPKPFSPNELASKVRKVLDE